MDETHEDIRKVIEARGLTDVVVDKIPVKGLLRGRKGYTAIGYDKIRKPGTKARYIKAGYWHRGTPSMDLFWKE